jgi:hypothetical protein
VTDITPLGAVHEPEPSRNTVRVSADIGVTGEDAEDAAELPTLFVATTVKVYGVPLVRPVIVIGEEDPDAVKPPGLDVTV